MSPIERTPQLINPLPLACPPHAAHSHWSCRTATARVYPFSYFIFGQHKFPEKLNLKRLSQFLPSSLRLLSLLLTCMHTLEKVVWHIFPLLIIYIHSIVYQALKKKNFYKTLGKMHWPLCVSMITICRALFLCLWLQHTHTHTHRAGQIADGHKSHQPPLCWAFRPLQELSTLQVYRLFCTF